MNDLVFQPAATLATLIREKKISPAEVLNAHLKRIEQVNPSLNAIIELDAERALRQAQAAETALVKGEEVGPLHGVPITIKSSIEAEGLRCECGSRLRQGQVAERDAPAVTRLRQAGAVILGNTNVPELLVAYETDNLLYGRTNNPWNLERTAGGSSGGEAAAIASGCSAAGMGSDGGGSVRVPAHFCGICGLKPSLGLIPRSGHWPPCLGPSSLLALVGPLARTVQDLQLLLEVTAGEDPADPSSAPFPKSAFAEAELAGLKIGWFEDDGITPVTAETRGAVRRSAELLAQQRFTVEPFRPKGMEAARELWWMLFGITGAAWVKPLVQGREHELHPLVQDLLAAPGEKLIATFEEFLAAWVNRDLLRAKLLAQMEEYRILLCPVSSAPAFRHGERSWRIDGQTVTYPKAFTYCQIFNLLGNPAVVVPVGRSADGLPIGVQVVGRPFEDRLVLAVARKLEEARGEWQAPPEDGT